LSNFSINSYQLVFATKIPNPTTFEFTASKPALQQARAFLHQKKNIIKMLHANSCAVNFYNAGVVTRSRWIGSWWCGVVVSVFRIRNKISWDRILARVYGFNTYTYVHCYFSLEENIGMYAMFFRKSM
jgi:hypothetical protein